jgi:hypothetical protein
MNRCPLCGSSNVDPALSADELLDDMASRAVAAFERYGRAESEPDLQEAMREALAAALEVTL